MTPLMLDAWYHFDIESLQLESGGGGFTSMLLTQRLHFSLSCVSLKQNSKLQVHTYKYIIHRILCSAKK